MRVIAIAALLAAGSGPARAATLHVPADFPSLTAAVARAAPGDRIVLGPGHYSVSGSGESFPLILHGADITVEGAGAGRTVLSAGRVARILEFRGGDESTIRGLTLRGGFAEDGGAAILVDGASPVLAGLRIEDCAGSGSGDAIRVLAGAPRFSNCLLTGGVDGPTVRLEGGAAVFEFVTVARNSGPAFVVAGDSQPTLRHSVIADAGEHRGAAIGLRLVSPRAVPVLENLLWSCRELSIEVPALPTVRQSDALAAARRAGGLHEGNPGFESPTHGDFRLHAPSGRGSLRPGLGAWAGPDPLPDPDTTAARTKDAGLLGPSVPNPLSLSTTIHFTVKDAGAVDLGVFNVLGQRVRTLYAGDLTTGEHSRVWDGRDDVGTELLPGIYFVRVTQGRVTESQRLVLVR